MEGRFRQQRLHTPHLRRDQRRVGYAAAVPVQREFLCGNIEPDQQLSDQI